MFENNYRLNFISISGLQDFQSWLVDEGYKQTSRARMLSALRRLFQYMHREGLRSDDPSALLVGPKLPKRLPKDLSEQQVDALLSTPDANDPIELRDKAMLELHHATGLHQYQSRQLDDGKYELETGCCTSLRRWKRAIGSMGEDAIEWIETFAPRSV